MSRVLALNPGATSTKTGAFDDETPGMSREAPTDSSSFRTR